MKFVREGRRLHSVPRRLRPFLELGGGWGRQSLARERMTTSFMENLERPRVADTTLPRASFLSRIDVD